MTALLLVVLGKAVEARSTNASPNTLALAEVRFMKVRYSNPILARRPFIPALLEPLSLSPLLCSKTDMHMHGRCITSTCFVLCGAQHKQTIHIQIESLSKDTCLHSIQQDKQSCTALEGHMIAQYAVRHTIMQTFSSSRQRRKRKC